MDIEDDYLLLEGNQKHGWCSLRYCEIIWMDSFKDKVHFERGLNAELLPAAPNRSVQPPFGAVQRRLAHQSHYDADAADERPERPVACGIVQPIGMNQRMATRWFCAFICICGIRFEATCINSSTLTSILYITSWASKTCSLVLEFTRRTP